MKTQALTRGAMCTALYGILLLINQQTGLMVESTLNWVFILPVLIYTAGSGLKAGAIAAAAMALMTFMFGTFTTWFYSWFGLLIGLVYGWGLCDKRSHMLNFSVSLVLSFIMYLLMIFLWSAIFGWELLSDFNRLAGIIPFLDFYAFCVVFSLFMAFLQTLCIHLIALMVCMRLHIEIRPFGSLADIGSSRFIGLASPILWLIFFFGRNMIEYQLVQTLIQILFFVDCIVLIFYGALVALQYGIDHRIRKFTLFAVLGAVIPIVHLVWLALGELDCLFSIRNSEL